MSGSCQAPRLHLPPGLKADRVTQPKPRRKPAQGQPASKPLQMPALPPRRVHEVPVTTPARAVPPQASPRPAPTAPTPPTAPPSLYRREALLALWDVDGDELTELVRDGLVLEVTLGRLVRFAPATHLPAVLLAGQPGTGAA